MFCNCCVIAILKWMFVISNLCLCVDVSNKKIKDGFLFMYFKWDKKTLANENNGNNHHFRWQVRCECQGHYEIILENWIIEKKIVIIFQDGARSIHTAARYGHVGIINTLLQKGESVDVTTNVRYFTSLNV